MSVSMDAIAETENQPLALNGGPPAIPRPEAHRELFHWPRVTREDEQAVLEVLRAGSMSAWDVTTAFEEEFRAYIGTRHALAYPNGTMALQAAMWAAGLRRGDEMICPSITYWASALQVFSLGGTVVFADVEDHSLCIDPDDIERHIGPRTRAIMVVHYCGHPADMDRILPIAARHGLKVIEDVSHAQGALYKGRMTGTFGHVSAMSMMAGKAFAIGEGGMLLTDDDEIHERAIAFSHYERAKAHVHFPELKAVAAPDEFRTGLPMGGVKGRMNQTCAAMGRVQLRHYPERIREIDRAMSYFWELLEDIPGLHPHWPAVDSGSTKGGWYNPLAHYVPEELGGLDVATFGKAIAAEGVPGDVGVNFPLHLHPLFNEADIYGDGKPTRIAFSQRDVRQPAGALPVAESIGGRVCKIPWFKQALSELIAMYAAAYRKVLKQVDTLQ